MDSNYIPQARRTGLVIQTLPQETLVLDTEREQANCLNETAALVWKYADGTRSVSEITAAVAQDLDTPVDSQMVWYALDQFGKRNLLVEPVPAPAQYAGMSRRVFEQGGSRWRSRGNSVIVSIAVPSRHMHSQGHVSEWIVLRNRDI